MADRGTWVAGTSYPLGDTVIWKSKKWEAIKNNVSTEPGTTGGADWREVAVPSLATLAKAAQVQAEQQAAAQKEAERQALRDEARSYLNSILRLPADVIALLPVVETDMLAKRVVFADASLALSVTLNLNVRPVRQGADGTWEPFLPPVTSLAELGAILP